MASNEIRSQLRGMLDCFPAATALQTARIEVSDLIVSCYVAGHLNRDEYHEAMRYVR